MANLGASFVIVSESTLVKTGIWSSILVILHLRVPTNRSTPAVLWQIILADVTRCAVPVQVLSVVSKASDV